MLEVNVAVQLEAGFDLLDRFAGSAEREIDVMAGVHVARGVGELLAADLVDLLDLGAFAFDLFRDGFDGVIDGAVDVLRIEDDQTLVFAAHLQELVW